MPSLATGVLVHFTSGFKLPCQLHQVIVARFADEELIIDFDNFVRCLVRLETLFSKWIFGGRPISVLSVLKQPAFHTGEITRTRDVSAQLRMESLL